jgi:tetrahydromethanopterin S-methyltransferase subunit B
MQRSTPPSQDVSRLRNFGKSFAQTEPAGLAKARIMLRALSAMRREIGVVATLRVLVRSRQLAKGVDSKSLDAIRDAGLRDERFLAARVEETSLVAALVEAFGLDRAREIFRSVLETMADDMMRELVPTSDELRAFPDPFGAFRDYLGGVMKANAAAAIHLTELRESSDDVVAYDVTYCAYERVAAAFGDARLCAISNCAGDDVSFPRICAGIDAEFHRRSTLAAGAPCCDFRFERRRDH